MEERIAKAVREFPGRAGLYCQELDTGRVWAVRGEEPFEAASVIKLPILVEVFRQLESGEAREDERFTIAKEDKLPSCGALNYLHTGLTVTLMDLAVLMIILSDNTATNLLIRRLGMERINDTIRGLGMETTRLRRLLFDSEAAARGVKNTISPGETGRLLAALYRGEVVSPAASARMLGILKDQRLNGKLPFWLDGKVACAHKTGEDKNITHDVGILYAPRPFVLCICGDPVDAPALNALMAQAARLLVQEQGVTLGGELPAF